MTVINGEIYAHTRITRCGGDEGKNERGRERGRVIGGLRLKEGEQEIGWGLDITISRVISINHNPLSLYSLS